MKYLLLVIVSSLSTLVFAQDPSHIKLRDELKAQNEADSAALASPWTVKSIFALNGSQTSFVNWAAGGRNNITAIGLVDFSAIYQKRSIKWNNDVKFALGGQLFLDSTGKKAGLQKTDDRIDIASAFGYEFKKKWFLTTIGTFKTQSLDGFSFPNDSVIISTFMAPAYVNISLGIEYAPKDYFNMYLSPIASKMTFVNNQVLADAGAFGVEKATYDPLTLLKLTDGKRARYEIGASFRMNFQKEILKNIEMKTRLELFSNYLNNPQNIDVNLENIFAFKINKWFSASLQWNLIYDDDISIRDSKGNTGPRTQFKSVLGLGISYTLSNKK